MCLPPITPCVIADCYLSTDLFPVQVSNADAVLKAGVAAGVNLRKVDASHVGISLDETTTLADVDTLLKVGLRF